MPANTVPLEILHALREAIADALLAEFDRITLHVISVLTARLNKADDQPDDADIDAALDDYTADDLAADLQLPPVITPLAQAYWAGGGKVEASVGIVWNLKHQRGIEYARNRAAELVGMRIDDQGQLQPNPSAQWSITQTTRDDLKALVVHLMETPGVSYRDLHTAIQKEPGFDGLFGEYRSEMIARSELAMAVNKGEIGGYRVAGITHVRVLDGTECPICGPLNGTIQTVEWADANPISHPNCVRSFQSVEVT